MCCWGISNAPLTIHSHKICAAMSLWSRLFGRYRAEDQAPLPMAPVPSCSIELPKRAAESRSSWVYKWHPTVMHATPEVSAADRL